MKLAKPTPTTVAAGDGLSPEPVTGHPMHSPSMGRHRPDAEDQDGDDDGKQEHRYSTACGSRGSPLLR
jgi:hypothetical protein